MIQNIYSDYTQITLGNKKLVRTGTAIEWAAFVKAGYVVNSTLKPVRPNAAQMPLSLCIPELGRWIASIRSEVAADELTDEDLISYVDNHAQFFSTLRR